MNLIYAIVDTIIVALLLERAFYRWESHRWFSAVIMLFVSLTFLELGLLRWGWVLDRSLAGHLNSPFGVLSRTLPLILILIWARRYQKDGC